MKNEEIEPATLIRRWGPVLAVVALVGGVVGGLLVGRGQTVFETTFVVLVGPVVPESDLLEGTTDLARTYGEIIETNGVIRQAAEGTGVAPGDVIVSASAGRASATLRVRVRTPSKEATPQVAVNLIEVLRTVVAENRADVRGGPWGVVEEALGSAEDQPDGIGGEQGGNEGLIESFPIGTAITVLDDGGGGVRDRSLGTARGAALGVLVAGLLGSGVALSVETRRADDPVSRSMIEWFGADLGRLGQRPILKRLVFHRRWRDAVPAIRSRQRTMQYASDSVAYGHVGRPSPTVVFLALPSSKRCYALAVAQLCSRFAAPPMVVDPAGLLISELTSRPEPESYRYALVVNGRRAAEIAVPPASDTPVDLDSAFLKLDPFCEVSELVLVVASVAGSAGDWVWWAAACDRAVALVRSRDLRSDPASSFASRLGLTELACDGAIALSRRWWTGRPGQLRLTALGRYADPESADHPADQLTEVG